MPPSKIQQTLARHRLGVPAILAIIVAAAAPMSVIFGGAAAAFATSGLVALPLACITIAVLLALWAPGYLAMGRDIANAGRPTPTSPAGSGGRRAQLPVASRSWATT